MISKLVARFYLVMSVLILVTSSCFSIITLPGGGDDPSSRVEPVVAFTNVTEDVGLSGVRGDSFAWGDYNNDGYQDLLVKGARLFRNNGPPAWDFTEVTKLVGLDSSGYAVWGDYNNDGYLDFYSAGNPYTGSTDNPDGSMDTLWRNNGPPGWTFTNATAEAGSPDDGYPSLAAGWGDYDRDGYLDIYVVNWRDLNDVRYPDVLWHNNGDGTFEDVTVKAGIDDYTEPVAGMGVNWGDYNNDGWQDIYVSNYLLAPNFLWENNQDGTFTNAAFAKGVTGEESVRPPERYYGHTAGSSWADFDNDGDLDLWQTNLAHKDALRAGICADSELLMNNGPAGDYTFTNIRDQTGIPTQSAGGNEELFFGVAWGDYDNDGDLDVWIPQIKNYIDYAYSYFFRNNGDNTFTDVSEDTGVRVWDSDGGCWCDYNNDGWLDLITEGKVPYENGKYEVRLYRSNGASVVDPGEGSWLSVKLSGKASNNCAIGARVSVTDETGRSQMREIEGGTAGHSYQHSLSADFGFGDYSGPVDITVTWPTGKLEKFIDVKLNQVYIIEERDKFPDLVVSELWSSKPEPEEGDKVSINARIANWGSAGVDSCRVKFFEGAVPAGTGSSDPSSTQIGETQYMQETIGPGNSRIVSVKWNTDGQLGANSIWAVVDDVFPSEPNADNNIGSVEITVVLPNEPPQPILKVYPTEVELPDAVVEFDATGSLDDGEIVEYYFYFGDGEDTYWVETPKVNHRYTRAGKFTASLAVKDDKDTYSDYQAKLEIVVIDPASNEPPSILNVDVDPLPAITGRSAVIIVDAEDPDDDIVEYSYTVEAGTIIGSGSTIQWLAPKQPGEYRLDVTVKDSFDNYDTTEYYITVRELPVELKTGLSISAGISPPEIRPDGVTPAYITATILWKDPETKEVSYIRGRDIKEFTADLSKFDGRSSADLRDNGDRGDLEADDGEYAIKFTSGTHMSSGTYTIPVTAELADGREITTTVSVNVRALKEEDKQTPLERLESPGFEALFTLAAFLIVVFISNRRRGIK